MSKLKLDLSYSGLTEKVFQQYEKCVEEIHKDLQKRSKLKSDMVGWLSLPSNYDKVEFERIKKCARKIKKDSEVLVVIGIGGSYLGARAVIEALTNNFSNIQTKEERKAPLVLFAGNNISSTYLTELMEVISNKDFSVNVISKSGTTTEPAIAFRFFRKMLEEKYGIKEARKRIYVTTDKKKGALIKLAKEEGYQSFVIPDNVGGRYSVLTAVGLLPIAVSGLNIDKLMNGAKEAKEKYNDGNIKYNDCYRYAVARNRLYSSLHKNIEILVTYNPKLHYVTEWWKQLFGESEGKELKGIYPSAAEFTTDLHSLGQYIQEGKRNLFETVINIEKKNSSLKIYKEEDDLDGLNYLEGKDLDYINSKAMEATIKAHVDGGVPNLILNMESLDEENIGHLIYFFELACAMSGRLMDINPFDQPGVEKYKINMFELLEKPGYTDKSILKLE